MKITFLDCTKSQYDGSTPEEKPVGGIEGTAIALAEALARKGHDVSVINKNNQENAKVIKGVYWSNYEIYDFTNPVNFPDILIANNDSPLFDFFPNLKKIRNTQYVLWLHNPVKLFKTIKKGKMIPLIKYWPVAVFIGEKQKAECSFLHPFKRRVIMPHGLTDHFLSEMISDVQKRVKQAIFFSQPYRGFKEVVDIWVKHVFVANRDAELKAYVGDIDLDKYNIPYSREELRNYGVTLMPKVDKSVLIEDLKKTRCMIYPGHRDETFCVAAIEANAMGVPIISYGRGSLSERIVNTYNGFCVDDGCAEEMGNKANDLLNDELLFNTMSRNSIDHVQSMAWDKIADQWVEYVFESR